jgi:chromate transporter
VATVAVILPSVIVITLIAAFLQNLTDNPLVLHAFNGIRAAVVAIIAGVVVTMLRKSVKDWGGWFIFISAFLLLLIFACSPFLMILYGCILGLLYQKICLKRCEK